MNHENLVNDVINSLSSKELQRNQKSIEEMETPMLEIKTKMRTAPIRIPYANVDWRVMNLPENLNLLKNNLNTIWEFSDNLIQLPRINSDETREACMHVIGQIRSFVSGNFSIDLDYDHIKEIRPITIEEEAQMFVDDGIRIIEAFIKGCEEYQLNMEYLMMQHQMETPVPKSSEFNDNELSQKILFNLIQEVPEGAIRPDVDINDVLIKINEWIQNNIPEEDVAYVMSHPSDESDPNIIRINNDMMTKGFGEYMAAILLNPNLSEMKSDENIDEQVRKYSENDITNIPRYDEIDLSKDVIEEVDADTKDENQESETDQDYESGY